MSRSRNVGLVAIIAMVLAALGFAPGVVTPAHAGVLTAYITPTADTYVDSSNPDSAFGSSDLHVSDTPSVKIAYLSFKLNLPTTATITSAQLRFVEPNVTQPTTTLNVYHLGNLWGEGQTYNTKPSMTTLLGTLPVAQNTVSTFPVPLSQFSGNTDKESFGLNRTVAATGDTVIGSRESPYTPQLIITYNSGTTDTNLYPDQPGAVNDNTMVNIHTGDVVTFNGNWHVADANSGAHVRIDWYIDDAWVANTAYVPQDPGAYGSISAETWTATTGTHTLKMVMDVANEVPESNETDNTSTRTFTVSGAATSGTLAAVIPTQDTFVASNVPDDTTKGNSALIRIDDTPKYGLMQFNITGVPSGATAWADLTVTATADTQPARTVQLMLAPDNWTEQSSWNSVAGLDLETDIGFEDSQTVTQSQKTTFHNIVVHNGINSFFLARDSKDTGGDNIIASSEATDTTTRPSLVTHWNSSPSSDSVDPVVNAGVDQNVIAGKLVQLHGSVTDDNLVFSQWAIVSGPGTSDSNMLPDAAWEDPRGFYIFSGTGQWVLRLTGTDMADNTVSDDVTINVTGLNGNLEPTIDAGTDQSISLPTNVAHLSGTVADDGLQNALTYSWTLMSGGPGTVTFSSPTTKATDATFSGAGTYLINLATSDGEFTVNDNVTVTVNSAGATNVAPTVNAGTDQTVTLPGTASLDGTVSDDGLPNGSVTTTWSKVSGAGTVTFGNSSSVDTSATFSAAGTYVLRLTANDGSLQSTDDVTVTVNTAPQTGNVTKVLTILYENTATATVESQAPYLAGLGNQYGKTTAYKAITHPSEPNYIAIAGGDTFGVTNDNPPSSNQFSGHASIFGQALASGHTAKTYAETMNGNCEQVVDGQYAVKHNPWAFFTDERSSCNTYDVPMATNFANDVSAGALPNVGMLVPNICNDAHNCSMATFDNWLKSTMATIQAGPDWQSGHLAVVITADEDDHSDNNTVYTAVVDPSLSNKVVSTALTHYSLTRMYEDMIGVTRLNNAATAPDMAAAFGLTLGQ